MRIEYGNLTIRNAGAQDAAQLAAWWNDGKVMAHAGFPNGLGITPEEIMQKLAGDDDNMHRRLILECGGRAIGEMNYRNQMDRSAEIGIKICDFSMQEKGLGRQYLSMLIGALFDMGYERICLDTNLKNIRAQHVYEKLGFEKIRVRENSWQDQLGAWQSAVDYALTQKNFVNFAK